MPNGHWSIDTWMIIDNWVLGIVSVSEKKRGDDTDAWTEYVIASEAWRCCCRRLHDLAMNGLAMSLRAKRSNLLTLKGIAAVVSLPRNGTNPFRK